MNKDFLDKRGPLGDLFKIINFKTFIESINVYLRSSPVCFFRFPNA